MSDLDDLMSRIEFINAKTPDDLSAADIDMIISYHRRNRQRKASGDKIRKPSVDISVIMEKLLPSIPAGPKLKRRL